jgi:circadian clock protein KaiB
VASTEQSLPQVFKGIAVFTPGGDLVYAIDEQKQHRWHLQLCSVLQELLGLPEPPHFLVPCYTATIDRWIEPHTDTIQQIAELYPMVQRYQSLLNVLFRTSGQVWTILHPPEDACDPAVLMTYRNRFPELWRSHELMICLDQSKQRQSTNIAWTPSQPPPTRPPGYVFRLFVSGQTAVTEQVLHSLHQVLERSLQQPYTLKIIDVQNHPELAESNQITATPTLVRVWPQPVKRIVGDLNSVSRILQDTTSTL